MDLILYIDQHICIYTDSIVLILKILVVASEIDMCGPSGSLPIFHNVWISLNDLSFHMNFKTSLSTSIKRHLVLVPVIVFDPYVNLFIAILVL